MPDYNVPQATTRHAYLSYFVRYFSDANTTFVFLAAKLNIQLHAFDRRDPKIMGKTYEAQTF